MKRTYTALALLIAFISNLAHSQTAALEESTELSKVDQTSAEHYVWGKASDGWHFLKRDDLSIIRERIPSGESEVMHYHKKSRQFFYILKGKATMVLDTESIVLEEGDGLEVPPKTWHQFTNISNEDVEILVVSMPRSHGDKFTRESE